MADFAARFKSEVEKSFGKPSMHALEIIGLWHRTDLDRTQTAWRADMFSSLFLLGPLLGPLLSSVRSFIQTETVVHSEPRVFGLEGGTMA